MDVIDTIKHGELGDQAQRALQTARETVGELVPASADRLRHAAERVSADGYLGPIKDLERDYVERAKTLERTLEKKAKALPIDTPFDRQRRRRNRRRGAKAGVVVVVASVGGVIAYVLWRQRRDEELGAAPLDASDIPGEHSTTTSPPPRESTPEPAATKSAPAKRPASRRPSPPARQRAS